MKRRLNDVEKDKQAIREAAAKANMDPVDYVRMWTRFAELYYKSYHGGKLPGSTRTARLRKKRAMKVLKWFAQKVESSKPPHFDRRSNLELAC